MVKKVKHLNLVHYNKNLIYYKFSKYEFGKKRGTKYDNKTWN